MSLSVGFIVMEAPCRRKADTLHLLLKLMDGKEIPPLIELGEYIVLEADSPQGRVFLSVTDLLTEAKVNPYARQLRKWLTEKKVRAVKGLQNLGYVGLYDEVNGVIYVSWESLSDPAREGIGPPGPAHDAAGLIALAGYLCHEAGHKWGGLGEEGAYALEESVYRRLHANVGDPCQKEAVRRCLYLFYNARRSELGTPVPREFTEGSFRFSECPSE